ncbi:MAG: DUF4340 domain-containing protein [Chloroflexi bacterium]|nr:DUF4340 domain-containing protein [Chloroflexota bacterium]
MRLNRGTIALIVLSLVVLGAIALFNNQQATPTATATLAPTGTSQGPVFSGIDTSTVNRFEVRDNSSGQGTVLTRDAALVWAISETTVPDTRAVDQARINIQLGNFVNLLATDRFSANLADFGLESPAYSISITRLDGTVHTVRVGNLNPGGSRYYVLADGQPEILLVQQSVIAGMTDMILNPPYVPLPTATPGTATPDTRRPLLTGVTADQIISLEIRNTTTGAATLLTRDSVGTWSMVATTTSTQPLDQFASFTAAANFTSLLYNEALSSADLPIDVNTLGLAQPGFVLIATSSTGTQYTLSIGGLNPAGTAYYTQLSTTTVVLPTPTPTSVPTLEATAAANVTATANMIATMQLTATSTPTITPMPPTATFTPVPPTATITPAPVTGTPSPAPTATPTPIIVYLIARETLDALTGLIAAPPYLPTATATVTATTAVTPTAAATGEGTPGATTAATAAATTEATGAVTATAAASAEATGAVTATAAASAEATATP